MAFVPSLPIPRLYSLFAWTSIKHGNKNAQTLDEESSISAGTMSEEVRKWIILAVASFLISSALLMSLSNASHWDTVGPSFVPQIRMRKPSLNKVYLTSFPRFLIDLFLKYHQKEKWWLTLQTCELQITKVANHGQIYQVCPKLYTRITLTVLNYKAVIISFNFREYFLLPDTLIFLR